MKAWISAAVEFEVSEFTTVWRWCNWWYESCQMWLICAAKVSSWSSVTTRSQTTEENIKREVSSDGS